MPPDSIVLWPDGDWCFGFELREFGFKSDDYEVIDPGCARWDEVSSGWAPALPLISGRVNRVC